MIMKEHVSKCNSAVKLCGTKDRKRISDLGYTENTCSHHFLLVYLWDFLT